MIPKFVSRNYHANICLTQFEFQASISQDLSIIILTQLLRFTDFIMSEFSCSIKSGTNFNRSPTVVENMEGGEEGVRLLNFKYLVYKMHF